MNEARPKKRLMLGGYFATLKDSDGRKRYLEKLSILGGLDPYETARNEWQDDVDMWPSITHIHICYTHQVLTQVKSC